jgi:RNAse (barnase) inhibitor barstar
MSATSLARLLGGGPSGVFVLSARVRLERLATLSRRNGLHAWRCDCTRAHSKRTVLAALARDLDLPEYFGGNWDALADCLTDLAWAPATGYVLSLEGLEGLARRAPRNYAVLIDVLADAVTFWSAARVPFYVLLVGNAAVLGSALPRIAPT